MLKDLAHKFVTILALFSLLGCARFSRQIEHWVEAKGRITSLTGTYWIYEANCMTVQDLWNKRTGQTHVSAEAFTDWDRKEIWYCTDKGLKAELENVSSFENLRKAAIRDSRIANPL